MGEIAFITNHQGVSLFGGFGFQKVFFGAAGTGAIQHYQGKVGIGHRSEASFNAELFDGFIGLADARGIDKAHGDSFDIRSFRYEIASGAWYIRDDGAILFEEPIEQAAFSGVRRPHDCERETVTHQIAVSEAVYETCRTLLDGTQAAQQFFGRRHVDIVFGEVDAGFEQGDQFGELRLERGQHLRYGSLRLAGGYAGLIESGRFDEVANGFGLRQIDAAVDIGAEGELAWFGDAGSEFEAAGDAVAKDYGRTVAGDLDYVFGGVRAGCGKESDDYFVYQVARCVGQFTEGGAPGGKGAVEADYPCRECSGLRPGKANYAYTSTAGWRGNGGDGVSEIQAKPPALPWAPRAAGTSARSSARPSA
jgi:hypothetical protein